MPIKVSKKNQLSGTKAETLAALAEAGYSVPEVYYFSVEQWNADAQLIVNNIIAQYKNTMLAVRSSALAEDTEGSSMAGAFNSILNIDSSHEPRIYDAIQEVIASFDSSQDNQVLIQPMVADVLMSGVVMTKSLDDGSPYYIINYDDTTGATDTVTSGNSINKTVYVYNGVNISDFDSELLIILMQLVRSLENHYQDTPLDIEYAIDTRMQIHLLQVRRITTSKQWNKNITVIVSHRIQFLREYIDSLMKPRVHLYGRKTLLGIMPDWNPAEMIGVVPHPLSLSLYRMLITKRVWSLAREKMGYRTMPNVELMVSLYGRAYVDVRNSMNSFLPEGLNPSTSEKIISAYISKLESDPHLHDKIEFDVMFTAYDFNFDEAFKSRYEGVLEKDEFIEFKKLMRHLTNQALKNDASSSLNQALGDIEKLKRIQDQSESFKVSDPFAIADRINTLVGECIEYGTIPFAIIARHGFIAESLIRSINKHGILTSPRVANLKKSIRTIAGEMSEQFYLVCNAELDRSEFLKAYGHIRPSSYDILSPKYEDRENLFEGMPQKPLEIDEFILSDDEAKDLTDLLVQHKISGVSANDLLLYVKKAIAGREYAKFVFSKHLSDIIEYTASWGEIFGFDRSDMCMLTIQDILDSLFSPVTDSKKQHYVKKIKRARQNYAVAQSFKLNYLIRSSRDVNVVPMQRNQANFVGSKIIEREIIFLDPHNSIAPDLADRIVCIEGADPGYDWIFSRNLAGLVTKYGGANSHMAIRCAELGIPAAIGCGEQPFERIINAGRCILDCQRKILEPIVLM